MDKRKRKQLFNVNIDEISLVKSSAILDARTILMKKRNLKEKNNRIVYKNQILAKSIKGEIYQYGLVPNKVDFHNEYITEEEIAIATKKLQKAIFSGKVKLGKEHEVFKNEFGYIMFAIYDKTGKIAKALDFPEKKIVKGGMIIGIQLSQKGLEAFRKGIFTGISVGGEVSKIEKSINKSRIIKQGGDGFKDTWNSKIFEAFLDELVKNMVNLLYSTFITKKKDSISYKEVMPVINKTIDKFSNDIIIEIDTNEVKNHLLIINNAIEIINGKLYINQKYIEDYMYDPFAYDIITSAKLINPTSSKYSGTRFQKSFIDDLSKELTSYLSELLGEGGDASLEGILAVVDDVAQNYRSTYNFNKQKIKDYINKINGTVYYDEDENLNVDWEKLTDSVYDMVKKCFYMTSENIKGRKSRKNRHIQKTQKTTLRKQGDIEWTEESFTKELRKYLPYMYDLEFFEGIPDMEGYDGFSYEDPFIEDIIKYTMQEYFPFVDDDFELELSFPKSDSRYNDILYQGFDGDPYTLCENWTEDSIRFYKGFIKILGKVTVKKLGYPEDEGQMYNSININRRNISSMRNRFLFKNRLRKGIVDDFKKEIIDTLSNFIDKFFYNNWPDNPLKENDVIKLINKVIKKYKNKVEVEFDKGTVKSFVKQLNSTADFDDGDVLHFGGDTSIEIIEAFYPIMFKVTEIVEEIGEDTKYDTIYGDNSEDLMDLGTEFKKELKNALVEFFKGTKGLGTKDLQKYLTIENVKEIANAILKDLKLYKNYEIGFDDRKGEEGIGRVLSDLYMLFEDGDNIPTNFDKWINTILNAISIKTKKSLSNIHRFINMIKGRILKKNQRFTKKTPPKLRKQQTDNEEIIDELFEGFLVFVKDQLIKSSDLKINKNDAIKYLESEISKYVENYKMSALDNANISKIIKEIISEYQDVVDYEYERAWEDGEISSEDFESGGYDLASIKKVIPNNTVLEHFYEYVREGDIYSNFYDILLSILETGISSCKSIKSRLSKPSSLSKKLIEDIIAYVGNTLSENEEISLESIVGIAKEIGDFYYDEELLQMYVDLLNGIVSYDDAGNPIINWDEIKKYVYEIFVECFLETLPENDYQSSRLRKGITEDFKKDLLETLSKEVDKHFYFVESEISFDDLMTIIDTVINRYNNRLDIQINENTIKNLAKDLTDKHFFDDGDILSFDNMTSKNFIEKNYYYLMFVITEIINNSRNNINKRRQNTMLKRKIINKKRLMEKIKFYKMRKDRKFTPSLKRTAIDRRLNRLAKDRLLKQEEQPADMSIYEGILNIFYSHDINDDVETIASEIAMQLSSAMEVTDEIFQEIYNLVETAIANNFEGLEELVQSFLDNIMQTSESNTIDEIEPITETRRIIKRTVRNGGVSKLNLNETQETEKNTNHFDLY